jgi:hypothetical protein
MIFLSKEKGAAITFVTIMDFNPEIHAVNSMSNAKVLA